MDMFERNALDLDPPKPLPKRPSMRQLTRSRRSFDRFQPHPGSGLTPRGLVAAYRAAERGYLQQQCDLFDDVIESDGNLRGLKNARIDGVAGADWLVQPGGEDEASIAAAKALEKALLVDELDFVEFLEHQLDATFYGFSVSEIVWGERDGFIVPLRFVDIPHRRFRIHDDNELRLLTDDDPSTGEALTPGEWVISRRRHSSLARAGLMRTLAWWALFKRTAMGDWMIFAEKFGVPMPTGYYKDGLDGQGEASDKAIEALEEALENIGEHGHAVLAESTRIAFADIAQRDGSVESVHPAIVAACDREMAKLIAGGLLNNDTGGTGSYALGAIHEGSFFRYKQADAVRFARTFMRFVGLPFIKYNGFDEAGAFAPKVLVKVVPQQDPLTRVQTASLLTNELGVPVDGTQLRDELGFRRAMRDEDATQPMKVPPPAEQEEPSEDSA